MGFENVGTVWTPAELRTHLGKLQKPAWCKSITFHHTGAPSLEQRPKGFTAQHIKNIQSYYQTPNKKAKKGVWKSGPHLFIDDDQCWGMCDFRQFGTHARSFNSNSIGIEVLGNYDVEAPNVGRGLACWQTAAAAGQILLEWLGLEASQLTVKFHRDDPKTTKTCPGKKVEKFWVLELMKAAGSATHRSKVA